jgi:DNA-binding NarL/FixJ family response regulator
MERLPVLIVTDHDDTIEQVRRLITPTGHAFEVARTSLDALRAAHARRFHLAIVDRDILSLPSGDDTAACLMSIYRLAVLPVASLDGTTVGFAQLNNRLALARPSRPLVGRRDDAVTAGLLELSGREWQVMRELLFAPSTRTVAEKLHLSPHTVHNHTKAVFKKMGVHSLAELLSLMIKLSTGPHEAGFEQSPIRETQIPAQLYRDLQGPDL